MYNIYLDLSCDTSILRKPNPDIVLMKKIVCLVTAVAILAFLVTPEPEVDKVLVGDLRHEIHTIVECNHLDINRSLNVIAKVENALKTGVLRNEDLGMLDPDLEGSPSKDWTNRLRRLMHLKQVHQLRSEIFNLGEMHEKQKTRDVKGEMKALLTELEKHLKKAGDLSTLSFSLYPVDGYGGFTHVRRPTTPDTFTASRAVSLATNPPWAP